MLEKTVVFCIAVDGQISRIVPNDVRPGVFFATNLFKTPLNCLNNSTLIGLSSFF